jgi:hypothetical protein
MRNLPDPRCWIFFAVLAFLVLGGEAAQAGAIASDILGVRLNSAPSSQTANLHDANNHLVPDLTLDDTSDGFERVSSSDQSNPIKFNVAFFSTSGENQARLNNHSVVNIGVKGYVYLLEKNHEVSDWISIIFELDRDASHQLTVTLTLNSDPLSGGVSANPSVSVPESGDFQDITALLFGVATDSSNPGLMVRDHCYNENLFFTTDPAPCPGDGGFPFRVVVKSDLFDVPEPSSLSLVLFGAVGFIIALRLNPRRASS